MSGTLKPVRFKLAWQNYRVGDVITPNGTLRDWLVGNGYAVIVDGNAQQDDGRPATLTRRAAAKLKAAVAGPAA